jgi:hypothetical protein
LLRAEVSAKAACAKTANQMNLFRQNVENVLLIASDSLRVFTSASRRVNDHPND